MLLPAHDTRYFLFALSITVLSACGGGGGGGSSSPAPTGSLAIAEVDADHDGLIEISALQQLDWIRNDLSGRSLTDSSHQANSKGCPSGGCFGYELVADLDFNTNGDGVLDNRDTYFDYEKNGSSAGWLPIPQFTATFEGNGHRISNLFINRATTDYVGLFSSVASSSTAPVSVRNIQIDGPLLSVVGRHSVGALIGQLLVAGETTITNTLQSGHVTGTGSFVGGTIGEVVLSGGSLNLANNTATSTVSAQYGIVGGLVGAIFQGQTGGAITFANNSALSIVSGESAGGLVGYLGLNDTAGSVNGNSSSGTVVSTRFNAGGLVASVSASSASFIDNHSVSSVSATGELPVAGGLIGEANGDIANSYATGTVNSSGHAGGLIGQLTCGLSTSVTQSHATGAVTGIYTLTTSGSSVTISGGAAGGLIGSVSSSYGLNGGSCAVRFSAAHGDVNGGGYVGGLIGSIDAYETNTVISLSDSFSSGEVLAEAFAGGVFGRASIAQSSSFSVSRTITLGELFVGTAWMTPNAAGGIGGALVLDSTGSAELTYNHWATDTTTTPYAVYTSAPAVVQTGNLGATRAELECPITADNVGCASAEIFHSWGTANNPQGQPAWSFGTTAQLPGLRFADGIHRPVYDGSQYTVAVETP